jgi:hypothetical protein
MNEQTAPTRAEIEAILWVQKQAGQTNDEMKQTLISFLHERGADDSEVDQILSDLPSYQNWTEDAV